MDKIHQSVWASSPFLPSQGSSRVLHQKCTPCLSNLGRHIGRGNNSWTTQNRHITLHFSQCKIMAGNGVPTPSEPHACGTSDQHAGTLPAQKDVPLWVGWAVFILSVYHHHGNPKPCRNMHVSVGHMGVPKTAHCRSKSLEAVKVGRWLWVCDNLNVHRIVCYEQGGTF